LYHFKKFLSVSLNYVYLIILSKVFRTPIKLRFPKIEAGFSLYIKKGAKLDLNNLNSRKNLNVIINGGELSFGKNCFVNNNCSFNCLEKISVGDDTIFGESVKVYDHNHMIGDGYLVDKNNFLTSPVTIGKNCWFGSNVVILKGVNITDKVIVGANSTVHKSICESGIYVNEFGKLIKIK